MSSQGRITLECDADFEMVVPTKNSIRTGTRAGAGIGIELMRSNETGCDPNHKRLTADRDRKTLRCVDPQTTA